MQERLMARQMLRFVKIKILEFSNTERIKKKSIQEVAE